MRKILDTDIYFSLTGNDIEPKGVTNRLDIAPTETWKKGDKGKYNLSLEYSCWKLST